jgi:hypothetical protein
MFDPASMPERLARFLAHHGATDVTVSDYVPMTGGYSRLMARFDAAYTLDGASSTRRASTAAPRRS